MVDTDSLSAAPLAPPATNGRPALPESVQLSRLDFSTMPAPGAMRELKAQTGRSFEQLCGPDADQADQFQTIIWVKLRRQFPGLRWDECADVTPQVIEEDVVVDPTRLADSGTSPPSAGSGV